MSLAEKIELIQSKCNEVAFGWNDSGCFWHFQWGNRGSGNMMDGIGHTFAADADESETFEQAVDALIKHMNSA